MAEKKEMHLICNAHIDPVWLWDWEEGAAAAVATFRSAASLAERYDYVFCHNEALLYEWAEEYEPALFERVKRLVKAGKWHIAGGWYLQPDCNLPSGESFIRQAMVGRAYFAEKFGAERLPKTAVNFDPFGHSLGLPQILKKCGYENYLFMRPFPGEGQGVPDRPFVWRGPDGSEVKAAAGGAYNTPLGKLRDRVEADYGKLERGEGAQVYNGGGLVVSCWGVGNHGGGPSAADLDYITGEIANGARAEIIHSTPDLLFSRLKTETVYEKSLNIAMPGCYTSAVRIKQKHRELESRLYSTEKMLAAAALNGLSEYPETELREAEKDLLFCEFHDILPGSCVRKGEETALKRLSRGLCVLDELRARAFFALCSGLPKAEAGAYPIAVCNPHPYTVKTAADCGFMLADQQWDESFWTGAEVYDGDKRLPSQIVREASSVNLDWAKRVVFDCELEPFSMRVFAAKPVKTERGAARALSGDAPYVHEDAFKRVVLNTKTGFIDGITAGGGKYVGRGAFAPTVYADNADPWGMGAGQRERLGKREKPFKLMAAKEAAAFLASDLPEVPPLRLVEDGEVCSVIEGFYKYAHSPVSVSTIVMRYTLYKNAPYTDVDLRVLWSGSDKMLKLHIPAAFKGEYAGQIAYGRESFPQTGRECAAHSWVSYGNRSRAFALLNDGVYGSSCENGDIGATLLRGAVYAAHPIGERPLIPSGRASDRIDHGERFYRFRFIAGKATEISDALDREAQIFNERPFALHMFPSGAGSLPRPALKLSGGAVTLTAFKRARNGDGYIVRLFNGSAKECRAVLTAFGTETPLSFGKFEIKTLRYRNGTLTECVAAEI